MALAGPRKKKAKRRPRKAAGDEGEGAQAPTQQPKRRRKLTPLTETTENVEKAVAVAPSTSHTLPSLKRVVAVSVVEEAPQQACMAVAAAAQRPAVMTVSVADSETPPACAA